MIFYSLLSNSVYKEMNPKIKTLLLIQKCCYLYTEKKTIYFLFLHLINYQKKIKKSVIFLEKLNAKKKITLTE